MPRHVVQRIFPEGLDIRVTKSGVEFCRGVVQRNAEEGVTWIESFVSDDGRRTFCVYDGPIRKRALTTTLVVVAGVPAPPSRHRRSDPTPTESEDKALLARCDRRVGAAARRWEEIGCRYEAALALASGDDVGAMREAIDRL